MAFVKRKEDQGNFSLSSSQNVNSKRQLIDTSVDVSHLKEVKNRPELTNGIDTFHKKKNEIVSEPSKEYEKIYCPLLWHFDFDIGVRGYEEEFQKIITTYGINASQVNRISEYYFCIVRGLLYMNDQRKVLWEDLAEIANALTFLCNMEDFRSLPEKYPYTNEILKLRDKLKTLCISTQNEKDITLYFDPDTKYQLLIHQRELSVFPRITFNQLISKFRNCDH
jgi:hypothetical protein